MGKNDGIAQERVKMYDDFYAVADENERKTLDAMKARAIDRLHNVGEMAAKELVMAVIEFKAKQARKRTQKR